MVGVLACEECDSGLVWARPTDEDPALHVCDRCGALSWIPPKPVEQGPVPIERREPWVRLWGKMTVVQAGELAWAWEHRPDVFTDAERDAVGMMLNERVSQAEASRRLGTSPQSFNDRLRNAIRKATEAVEVQRLREVGEDIPRHLEARATVRERKGRPDAHRLPAQP